MDYIRIIKRISAVGECARQRGCRGLASLADAEAGEDLVENGLDVDAADERIERR